MNIIESKLIQVNKKYNIYICNTEKGCIFCTVFEARISVSHNKLTYIYIFPLDCVIMVKPFASLRCKGVTH